VEGVTKRGHKASPEITIMKKKSGKGQHYQRKKALQVIRILQVELVGLRRAEKQRGREVGKEKSVQNTEKGKGDKPSS